MRVLAGWMLGCLLCTISNINLLGFPRTTGWRPAAVVTAATMAPVPAMRFSYYLLAFSVAAETTKIMHLAPHTRKFTWNNTLSALHGKLLIGVSGNKEGTRQVSIAGPLEDLGEGDVDVKADHNRCHPGVQGYRGELDRL